MLGMMIGDGKRKDIADGIVESFVKGKKEYSTERKEISEACLLCAQEFLIAIEMRDPRKLIAAFIALDAETSQYTGEELED